MPRRATPRTPDSADAAPTGATQLIIPWTKRDEKVFTKAAATATAVQAARTAERQQLAAIQPAPLRVVIHPVQAYPSIFVCVPRAVAAAYGDRPWAEVLAAAERGEDGLAVSTDQPWPWQGVQAGAPRVPDVAWLAEGQDDWRGRTVLFQQNW